MTQAVRALIAAILSVGALVPLHAQLPGRCEDAASSRTSELGCYVAANQPVGQLPEGPIYWHVYEFPSRAEAEAVSAPHKTVIEAFKRVYLYALAPESWTTPSGRRLAAVGPLPHSPGVLYTARYLEGTIPGGEKTPAHTHPGAEAWYLVDGAQCLETPDQTFVAHSGDSTVVPPDVPMMLSSLGTETRHSLALILHDSAHPWTHVTPDGWKPAGKCPK